MKASDSGAIIWDDNIDIQIQGAWTKPLAVVNAVTEMPIKFKAYTRFVF